MTGETNWRKTPQPGLFKIHSALVDMPTESMDLSGMAGDTGAGGIGPTSTNRPWRASL